MGTQNAKFAYSETILLILKVRTGRIVAVEPIIAYKPIKNDC